MRLLFLSNLFPSSVEPTRATYNANLLRAIRDAGHEVRVVAPIPWIPIFDRRLRGRQAPPRRERFDAFTLDHPRYLYTPGFLVHWHHRFYRRAVAPVLRDLYRTVDIDHAILGFLYPDVVAMGNVCQRMGKPYIVRVNGSDFTVRTRQADFAPLVDQALREAPAIVCPGRALAEAIQRRGIPADKVHAFNNGVDHALFDYRRQARRRRILFVGNLVAIKGPDRLLQAFSRLAQNDPEVCLDIVGQGPMKADLQHRAHTLGLGERVVFHGQKPASEVADDMRRAACLCLTSRSEGMPNVVLEALACGAPVVATAVGETPYVIANGQNGFLVDTPADESEIADQLALNLARVLDAEWNHGTIAASVKAYDWASAAEVVLAACGIFAAAQK